MTSESTEGFGLHGKSIPSGEVVRLTEVETSVCGDCGRVHGLLQLSDRSCGRDFDEPDETNIRELAALIGEMLDALRLAAQQPA